MTAKQHSFQLKRGRKSGFTIAEVMLALMIFTLMTLMFGAIFPMATRGAKYSSNYAQGAMLAQHKIDQLRSAGYSGLSGPNLSAQSIIDSTQPNGYPIVGSSGTTYSFTTIDNLVTTGTVQGFFSSGSMGTVKIADYNAVHPSSGVPAGTMALATVTVSWTGGGISNGSYTTSAVIANIAP